MVTGFVVGWTVHNGFGALLAGVALLLLFAFAMAWIGVWLGLSVPTVEVAQQVVVHGHLPDHVRVERVRPDREHARPGSSRSPSGTRPAR